METTFEKAQVGDKVWSVEYGWGKIVDINNSLRYPITVEFNDFASLKLFSFHGSYEDHQTLFWDEIPIVAPPRPKRMVRKAVEFWLNIYPENPYRYIVFPTREEADLNGNIWRRIACVNLTGEYEVEEG
jgi:hypothetical protein